MENEQLNIGKRLSFLRKSLGLTIKQVAVACDIPNTSYFNREMGSKTFDHSEYLRLASFFNYKWKEKFTNRVPEYLGQPLSSITPAWLVFGQDKSAEHYNKIITELWQDFGRKEMEYIERINDLENIIDRGMYA